MILCPCCKNYTIEDEHDICEVCFWEKDLVAELNPNMSIGANHISLSKARENYREFGACEKRFIHLVRKPLLEELSHNNNSF